MPVNDPARQARDLYQQQRFAECEQVCRAMLSEDPNNVDALSTLGYLAMQAGEPDMAADYLEAAGKLEPDDAGHQGALATALRMAGKHEAALAAQARAARLAPDDPALLTNLALQYAEAGQFDDAADYYEQAIEKNPRLGQAHYGLALIRKFEPDDPRIEGLLTLYENPQLTGADRASFAFTLGRAFNDLGDYDRAFEYFREGNNWKKQRSRYDRAAERAYAQKLCEVFNDDLRAQNAGAGNPASLPVFIVGMPRSGSTLVEQVLSAHPQAVGGGELPWAGHTLERGLARESGNGETWPASASKVARSAWTAMGDAYLTRIAGPAAAAVRHLDKQLFNYLLVGPIHLMLPGARFIWCRRDPLDTCVSCYTHNFGGDRGFSNDLEDLGSAFATCELLMTHWQRWLPEGAMTEVRYEDMVRSTPSETRRLLDFLGLPWADECLAFGASGRAVTTSSLRQVRQGIYQSSVGSWRRYEKHLGPLRAALGDADSGT